MSSVKISMGFAILLQNCIFYARLYYNLTIMHMDCWVADVSIATMLSSSE
jgi:hypothetical protein